jgi:hypothetical protein
MPKLTYFNSLSYGGINDLEVLIDPSDNSLWVASTSIEKMLQYRPNSARDRLASKSFKAFAGNGLTPGKTVEGIDSLGRPNKIKAVPFDTVLQLVYWEAFHGKPPSNEPARALLMAGFADSFSSLILEQCGVKLEYDQRQETVSFYLGQYHGMMDWVRDTYLARNGEKPGSWYYREINIAINQFLFGVDHFNRDRLTNASTSQLRSIENFHMYFMTTKTPKRDGDPLTLLKEHIAKNS